MQNVEPRKDLKKGLSKEKYKEKDRWSFYTEFEHLCTLKMW